jgi:hypothetical protein
MIFFLTVVSVLIFLKPDLLAFTLGIGVVIFGAIATAVLEVLFPYRRPLNE